jgi:hypothetical protein
MKSFEIPIARWQGVERQMRCRLEELESWRERFGALDERIKDAVDSIRRSDLPGLMDSRADAPKAMYAVVPQAGALEFARRHLREMAPLMRYREVVRRIVNEHDAMVVSSDLLKEFHRCVVGPDAPRAGQWKAVSNFIPGFAADGRALFSILTTHPKLVAEYMERLHDRVNSLWRSGALHPLLLASAYSLDLLAIHPFADGNGRISRLVLLLLLYKAGHFFGRYVSLEGAMNRRGSHVGALRTSLDGWPIAQHDPSCWCAFVLDVVRDCYTCLSGREHALSASAAQIENLIASIRALPAVFRSEDLKALHPDIPDTMVRIVLNRMCKCGRLRVAIPENQVLWQKASGSV